MSDATADARKYCSWCHKNNPHKKNRMQFYVVSHTGQKNSFSLSAVS